MYATNPCEHRAFRLPVAATLAVGVTLALFLLMQEMIRNDFSASDASISPLRIIFGERVVVPRNESIPHPPPKPVKPTKTAPVQSITPDIPHDVPPVTPIGLDSPEFLQPARPPHDTTSPADEFRDGGGTGTNPATARQMLPLRYPPNARRQGIEGYVIVAFTVTANGTVIDAHVVESHPARVFDKAALKAIYGWRFRPARKTGTPVSSQLIQRIEFNLSEE